MTWISKSTTAFGFILLAHASVAHALLAWTYLSRIHAELLTEAPKLLAVAIHPASMPRSRLTGPHRSPPSPPHRPAPRVRFPSTSRSRPSSRPSSSASDSCWEVRGCGLFSGGYGLDRSNARARLASRIAAARLRRTTWETPSVYSRVDLGSSIFENRGRNSRNGPRTSRQLC